tara:strand:+ start:174 stop:602 length:429 start_codon:yes stop_codon:yes gene_type:complete
MLKKVLNYPLKIFSNTWVLKSVVHSIWMMFALFVIAYALDYLDKSLFEKFSNTYDVLKGIFNLYLSLTIMGYFLSKYKFCVISLVSFYGIIILRLTWYINEIYPFNYYEEINIIIIILALLIITIHKINAIMNPLKKKFCMK